MVPALTSDYSQDIDLRTPGYLINNAGVFYLTLKEVYMARLNTVPKNLGPSAPLKTAGTALTHEGGAGFLSDEKTEVFRLGVNLMVGEKDSFYESQGSRDKRFTSLIESLAVSDPSWVYGFLTWLRSEGNIRTASIVGAAHAVHARLTNSDAIEEDELLSSLGMPGINRALVSGVCQRADEPGEFLAYYKRTFKSLPQAVKRGLADAANNLYSEYSVMKYDTDSHGVRFADVLNLTHARPGDNQEHLYGHIINRRFGNEHSVDNLTMIRKNKDFRKEVANGNLDVLFNAGFVKAAGLTWEDVLSLAGSKIDKAKLWEGVIPSMGYMALLRNLRNFEEAGISKESRQYVTDYLTDPQKVARSRQFPFRFMSAYEQVLSEHYKPALSDALDLSTQNIPVFNGKTLVLVDLSYSMQGAVSSKSKMTQAKQAALFGAAVALKNAGNADLVAFATSSKVIPVKKGASVLKIAEEMNQISQRSSIGGGTNTGPAILEHFNGHNRICIFTDGQSFPVHNSAYGSYNYYGYVNQGLRDLVPANVYMYGWDLAGYKVTDLPAGENRTYQLGGLSDATFKMIPLLEAGKEQDWPWLNK